MSEPGREAEARAPEAEADARPDAAVRARLAMPDRWLEHVEDLPLSMTVEEAKAIGLRAMLLRTDIDPDDFYTEYAERQVTDEGVTLRGLGFQSNEVLSIRAYDLGHYPRFRG